MSNKSPDGRTLAEQGIKVRTISVFATLGKDPSAWSNVLKPAALFAARLAEDYASRGYEVQSLRLILNPFGEYLDTSDSKQALTRVQNRVDDTAARLRSGAQTARSLSTLVETTVPLVETADSILENAGARMDILRNGSGDGNVAGDLEAAVGNVRGSVSTALDATQASYEGVRDRVNELVDGTQYRLRRNLICYSPGNHTNLKMDSKPIPKNTEMYNFGHLCVRHGSPQALNPARSHEPQ